MAQQVSFEGARGQRLAGLLDLPEGEPVASALFAHCFTCGKDSIAAARVARSLTERGIAVLRFDVTGLGESEGDFADTTFTCDVADLAAAAEFLGDMGRAPSLLVGHSLGGAAVIAAASRIPSATGVVVVAAPSDPGHVVGLLGDAVDDLREDGVADVSLAGRPFRLRESFLDDITQQRQRDRIAGLDRALLVMHSPDDTIVGIDNAREIYDAARHPKSFITLDGADHLLTDRNDAEYVADVVAAWSSRYVTGGERGRDRDGTGEPDAAPASDAHGAPASDADGPDGEVLVRETGDGRYQQEVTAGRHRWTADEPEDAGGDDAGPSPYDLLLASLGTCTAMTIRMYARRKGWELGEVRVALRHDRVRGRDRDECDSREDGCVDRIQREIALDGELSEDQRAALLAIAEKCPVHRSMRRDVVIESSLA